MLLTICSILPLFYGTLASPQADQYIDNVLFSALPAELRSLNLDPAPLTDFHTEFKDKIAIIGSVKGRVNYTNGQLTGLSKVQRMSACGGPTYKFGAPTINCTIGFQQLETSFNGKMKYGKMPVVPVKAKGNITTTTVYIEIAQHSPNQQPTITNSYFQKLGVLNTKFTGLGSPLNKILKVLEEGYKTHVNAEIMNSLNQRFIYALKSAVARVPMPH